MFVFFFLLFYFYKKKYLKLIIHSDLFLKSKQSCLFYLLELEILMMPWFEWTHFFCIIRSLILFQETFKNEKSLFYSHFKYIFANFQYSCIKVKRLVVWSDEIVHFYVIRHKKRSLSFKKKITIVVYSTNLI